MQAEFGPTLPVLLNRRFGISRRASAIALAAVALALAAAVAARGGPGDGRTLLVHREPPQFRFLYDPAVLRPVAEHPGELERLEGRHGPLSLTFSVRPFPTPTPPGPSVLGALPIYAHAHVRFLQRTLPGFRLRKERHTRINWAPGYEVQFRYGRPGRRVHGRDVLLFEAEDSKAGALLLSARHTSARRPGASSASSASSAEKIAAARRTLRSFSFGTE